MTDTTAPDAITQAREAEMLALAPLQPAQPPRDRVFYARQHVPMKWTPYKPTSQEVKRGKKGRWQQRRAYGLGWENADEEPQAGAWIEDVINHPDRRLAAHGAGEGLREALQAQEDAEDARDGCECGGEGQWEHCGPCSERFGRAICLRREALADVLGRDGDIETDPSGEAMVCTGCGTTRTLAAIRRRSQTAFSCCPERKMVPVRAAIRAPTAPPSDAGSTRQSEAEQTLENCLRAIRQFRPRGECAHYATEVLIDEIIDAVRKGDRYV